MDGKREDENIKEIYDVCLRHGEQVEKALNRMIEKHDRPFSNFRPTSLYSLILGMRSENNNIELLKLDPEGGLKERIPHGKLVKFTAEAYEKLLLGNGLDVKTEETKLNKNISIKVINELEKNYSLKHTQKKSIHDYFRKRKIEARIINGEIEVKTNKY